MARKNRDHIPGGMNYVVLKTAVRSAAQLGSRGPSWEPIFRSDAERTELFSLLPPALRNAHTRLHSFCVTTTDIRLLVEVSDIPLGRFVQQWCTRYARRVNQMRGCSGRVFRQRYQSVLLNDKSARPQDADSVLREVVHHIERTPVEARITAAPEDYRWSSHRGHLGMEAITWLTHRRILQLFDQHEEAARRAYARYVGSAVSGEPWHAAGGAQAPRRFITGDAQFLRWLRFQLKDGRKPATLAQVIEAACTRLRVTRTDLLSASRERRLSLARALVTRHATQWGIASGAEVSRALHRDQSTLYVGVERYRRLYRDLFSMPLHSFLNTQSARLYSKSRGSVRRATASVEGAAPSDAQLGSQLARVLLQEPRGRPRATRIGRE
jgi:hypothetical protein